jgi:hypothetical protein
MVYDLSFRPAPDDRSAPMSQTHQSQKEIPRKPTNRMLAAGVVAGGVTPDIAWRIYRAMLDAIGED